MKPATLVFGLALAAAALAADLAPAAAAPDRLPGRFSFAYAHNDCAPWDGVSLTIALQERSSPRPKAGQAPTYQYPQILIHLWRPEVPLGSWFPLPSDDGKLQRGNIVFCPAGGKYERRPGQVILRKRTEALIEGEVRFDAPLKGGVSTFPFSAPIFHVRVFCG